MSILISSAIDQCRQELNILSQRVSDSDFLLFFDRANKFFNTSMRLPTVERESNLLLFTGVKEYPLPSDYTGIIEPKRPYDLYSPDFANTTPNSFVHWPYGRQTAIKWIRETPFLIANESSGSSQLINACDSLTDNGTWAISGDGSSLAVDSQIFTAGTGSLRFTVTASGGTTTLTCTSMSSTVDLTDYLTQGWIFLDLDAPSTNTADLTSVRLRVGSSASAYYQMTSTTRFRGDTIGPGWGQMGFDLSGKTTTGSPTVTAINYIQILLTTGTTGIDGTYRVDNIFGALPTFYLLPYYSKNNIKAASGTYKESPTATDDTILCPSSVDEGLIYKTLEIAAAIRLKDQSMANYFRGELEAKIKLLKRQFPTQESKVSSTYYKKWRDF